MYENRVELMGFLGKSPESKSTKKTGRTLAILSLATKTWWKDKDEQPQEKTEWHRVMCRIAPLFSPRQSAWSPRLPSRRFPLGTGNRNASLPGEIVDEE